MTEIICKHCNELYITKGKYDAHYKSIHQKKIKLNKVGENQVELTRSNEEKFVCYCGKEFTTGFSLQRHAKSCETWKDHEQTNLNSEESENSIFLIFAG